MPNTILTPLQITRKALMILHQKANFIGSIDRQHDKEFAKDGAKIGDTLRIRLPNKYVLRNSGGLNTALQVQDTVEEQVSLVLSKRAGVDLSFTSTELTLSLDDFSARILEPAISVLAAGLEADAMTMSGDVSNIVPNAGAAITLAKVLQARKILSDNLAPLSQRTCNLNTQDNVDLVSELKVLFNAQKEISSQYLEGYMGHAAGFDFMENTLWPRYISGARTQLYQVNGTLQSGTNLIVGTGTGAIKRGDVFTLPGVFAVHPETKQITTTLQTFTVTEDYAGGGGTIKILPGIYPIASTWGGRANVSNSPTTTNTLTFLTAASSNAGLSLAYHKSAFTFATADLVMPGGVDFKAREVMDGISMRIIRAYDINSDAFPCRIDVHYGYVAQRPQLAVKLVNS